MFDSFLESSLLFVISPNLMTTYLSCYLSDKIAQLGRICCTYIQVLFHVLQVLNGAANGSMDNIKPI